MAAQCKHWPGLLLSSSHRSTHGCSCRRFAAGSAEEVHMYQTILVPVENAETDQTILHHIRPLARLHGSKLLLMHVADGWAARNFEQLKLQESEEMIHDRDYLRTLQQE